MSRHIHPLQVPDLTAFAKSLREQLTALDHPPTHVEMLNLCCRAVGYRNYQQFRARTGDERPAEPQPDLGLVEKAARHFDSSGRMLRWPARAGQADLCLWVLWSRLPANTVFTEREISAELSIWHVFGDAALLRRAMYEAKLVRRTIDGSEYRRIEQKPPAELRALLDRITPAQAA